MAAGLTQAELARRAGTSRTSVAAIESGKRTLTPQMRRRLFDAIGTPSKALAEHRDEVLARAASVGASNIRVFGSVARGTDTPDSDVDLLATPEPGAGFRFMALYETLADLLGFPVDVVSERGLGPKHARILTEAVPL